MPTVRYRVRNEYGLADPVLYESADKDDPEAILEGVAMAGLVGLLRQLGDLAEFAAEIFHDLHEEVMTTAARGHGLMLRVQQLEAEVPSIEKEFVTQSGRPHFSYNSGVDWHAKIRVDQNLITSGDMPRFILDSYEECRGPPRLFVLDKFDVAGAGACLKRYSDPSFFKINLASSGMMEEDIREKKARKVKKRGSRWRNGETLGSLLAPHMDSSSPSETSDQVPEKNSRRVKLKSRLLSVPDTDSSYKEKLFEVYSSNQEILLENSINHYHTKSVDSSESVPEIHEIVVDSLVRSPFFRERSPTDSPAKQEETGLSTNTSKKQTREGAELPEALPELFVEAPQVYSTRPIVKLQEMATNAENISNFGGYNPGNVEENLSVHQEVDQMELLTDDDCKRRVPDGYRSDDVASELENYMDALNTMESEVETDNESKVESNLGYINVDSPGMNADINERQQDLEAQFSERDTLESSTSSLRLNKLSKTDVSSVSDSDIFHKLASSSTSYHDVVAFDLQEKFEAYLSEGNDSCIKVLLGDGKDKESKPFKVSTGETNDKTSGNFSEHGEELVLKSSDHFLHNETFNAKASEISYLRSETGELSSSSSVTDLGSSLIPLCPQRSYDETQEISATMNEILSDHVKDTHGVTELLYGDQSCSPDVSELPCPANDEMGIPRLDRTPERNLVEFEEERAPEDVTGTLVSHHLHQIQDANVCVEVCAQDAEDFPLSLPVPEEEPGESNKQDIGAASGGRIASMITASDADSLIVLQPDYLAVEERISDGLTQIADVYDHFSQAQCENILEELCVLYAGDLPLSSPVPEGVPEELIRQNVESSSSGCISPIIPASGTDGSGTVVQPDYLAVEMESVVVPVEDLAKLRSVAVLENADDIVENKFSVSKVPSLESEHYSDTEGPQESYSVDSTELVQRSNQKESWSNGMSQEFTTSNIVIFERPNSIGDNLKPSYESTSVVDPLKDEISIVLIECNDLLTESVTIEAKGDSHDPCSVYSPEESCSYIHLKEDSLPHDMALNWHNFVVDETPGLDDTMRNMSLFSQNEGQLVSSPIISSFDSYVPNSYNSIDAKFLEDDRDKLPYEHAHIDFDLNSDIENQVPSLESKQDSDLKSGLQRDLENAQNDMHLPTHLLTEPAVSYEEASEVRASSKLEPNSLRDNEENCEHLLPSNLQYERTLSTEGTGLLNNSVDIISEIDPHDFASSSKTCELESPPSSQSEPGVSISLEGISEASVSSLAIDMATGSSKIPDFVLPRSKTTSLQSSELWMDEPSSSSPIQDLEETPPLPPLPPLEWRMGKLRLGSLLSNGNAVQSQIRTNTFMAPSATHQEHLHSLLTLGDEMVRPADLSTTLPPLKETQETVQPSFIEERKMVEMGLSELPPITDDERPQSNRIFSEGEMVHPVHPPSLESPIGLIQDDKHLYAHNSLRGYIVHPSNPFVQLPSLEDEISQHSPEKLHEESSQFINLAAPPQFSGNEGPSLLGEVSSNIESSRSQHGALNPEIDYEQPPNSYHAVPTTGDAKHQSNSVVYGGENILPVNMLVPLPTTGPMIPPHGSGPFMGQNPFIPYDIIEPAAEYEKPYRKRSSILNRPRSPLIEAVALHDKSTLRKVSEMAQPPTRPKEGERDMFLDQIKNKSFNLKPAVAKKPSIKGPPTNLKVAAILEKANAIRQAFVGSDEDDDGDSWSDS